MISNPRTDTVFVCQDCYRVFLMENDDIEEDMKCISCSNKVKEVPYYLADFFITTSKYLRPYDYSFITKYDGVDVTTFYCVFLKNTGPLLNMMPLIEGYVEGINETILKPYRSIVINTIEETNLVRIAYMVKGVRRNVFRKEPDSVLESKHASKAEMVFGALGSMISTAMRLNKEMNEKGKRQ